MMRPSSSRGWRTRLARRLVAVAAAAVVFSSPLAAALELPRERAVAGGVALVELGPALVAPQASLDGVPVLVAGRPGGWTAVVGIPLEAAPGSLELELRAEGEPPRRLPVAVGPVRYAEQRLKVAPGKVDLSPLISATIPFADSIAAFDRAVEARDTDVKIQIRMPD